MGTPAVRRASRVVHAHDAAVRAPEAWLLQPGRAGAVGVALLALRVVGAVRDGLEPILGARSNRGFHRRVLANLMVHEGLDGVAVHEQPAQMGHEPEAVVDREAQRFRQRRARLLGAIPAEFVPAVDGIGVVRREEGLRLLSLRRREIRIRVALVERWKYFHAPVENFSQMLGAVPSPRRVVYALVGFVRQTLEAFVVTATVAVDLLAVAHNIDRLLEGLGVWDVWPRAER
mmetsp:Transcript_23660/g.69648  ORF Transcript_23660/g.69648 Transcript_23660/m.69648 type:complete len:231 (+) Transcript_23660:559-1251(+)